MTEERDPADLPPITCEVPGADGQMIEVAIRWEDEADLLEVLVDRHRQRVAARQAMMREASDVARASRRPKPRKSAP